MEDGADCSPVSSRSTQVTLGHYTVPSMSPTPQTLSPTVDAMGVIMENPGVHLVYIRIGSGGVIANAMSSEMRLWRANVEQRLVWRGGSLPVSDVDLLGEGSNAWLTLWLGI